MTLVQAKRFSAKRPIRIEAVQALESVVSTEGAHRGLFVTTSRFYPAAKKFAELHKSRLVLADFDNIKGWLSEVANTLEEFNVDLTDDQIYQAMATSQPDGPFVGMIVHATWGYNTLRNEFGLVVRATQKAIWILPLKTKMGGDGFIGDEEPIIPSKNDTPDNISYDMLIFARLVEKSTSGEMSFWGNQKLFFRWDGKPKPYDHLD